MISRKHIDLICMIVIIAAVILTLLFMNGSALGIQTIVDEDAESYTGDNAFTDNDLNGSWDTEDATFINCNGAGAEISGGTAYTYDGNIYLSSAGKYVISGTLSDGSIIVDTERSSKVWILLDGLSVSCTDDAAIRVNQADKVFLTLADGTVNTLTSGESYSEEALSDGAGGTLFSHDDLTINGSGSLQINASYRHGIDGNDDLVITGGTITIDAPEDGIHVNDAFRLTEATLSIQSGDDGIHSDQSVLIAGGTLQIHDCYEGIEAMTVELQDGTVSIRSTDDGINATAGSSDTGTASAGTESADPSEEWILISGGSLTILNSNGRDADGLDSNGDILLTGGTVLISLVGDGTNNAIDYGSEFGGICRIDGGTLIACGGSSMTETFSSDSTQCVILDILEETQEGGTTVSLKDESGNLLLSWTPESSYSAVGLSCPALSTGETYEITTGEITETVTLTETSTTIGELTGFAGMGGANQPQESMGGQMGRGGFEAEGVISQRDASRGEMEESEIQSGGLSRGGMQAGGMQAGGMQAGEMKTGEMPAGGMQAGGMQAGGMPQFDEEGRFEDASQVKETGGTLITELPSESIQLLILCGAVLTGGIIFAVVFRRRRR